MAGMVPATAPMVVIGMAVGMPWVVAKKQKELTWQFAARKNP
jgi:hypothetical protein